MKKVVFGIKYSVLSIGISILFLGYSTGAVHASEEVYYIHSDHMGSNSVITKNGVEVERTKYYPYGTERGTSNQALGNSVTEKSYTGQISDKSETGLLYYNARYYDPSTAKFTQPDVIKETLNTYAYVVNNPVNIIDPSGSSLCDFDSIFAVGILCNTLDNASLDFYHYVKSQRTEPVGIVERSVYKGIYNAVALGGKIKGYDLASGLMVKYLYDRSAQPFDSSWVLEKMNKDYSNIRIGEFSSNESRQLSTRRNSVWDFDKNGRLNANTSLSFLFGMNWKEDKQNGLAYAFGSSTFKLLGDYSVETKKINSVDVVGVLINSPELYMYEIYDFDRPLGIQFEIPGVGLYVYLPDDIGHILERYNQTYPFDIRGRIKLDEDLFIPFSEVDDNEGRNTRDVTCFLPGTKITMSDGFTKNIEEVEVGDKVLSWDFDSNKSVANEVAKVLVHENKSGGYLLINGSTKVTREHFFWVESKGEWLRAYNLEEGDILKTLSGTQEIKSIELKISTEKVYNLHLLNKQHNYFADGVLVHNWK